MVVSRPVSDVIHQLLHIVLLYAPLNSSMLRFLTELPYSLLSPSLQTKDITTMRVGEGSSVRMRDAVTWKSWRSNQRTRWRVKWWEWDSLQDAWTGQSLKFTFPRNCFFFFFSSTTLLSKESLEKVVEVVEVVVGLLFSRIAGKKKGPFQTLR